jgi:hypothetical protein
LGLGRFTADFCNAGGHGELSVKKLASQQLKKKKGAMQGWWTKGNQAKMLGVNVLFQGDCQSS